MSQKPVMGQITMSNALGFKPGDSILINNESYKMTACVDDHTLTIRKLHVWDQVLDWLRYAFICATREFRADVREWWYIEDQKRGISRPDLDIPPPSPWLDKFENFLQLWHRAHRGDA